MTTPPAARVEIGVIAKPHGLRGEVVVAGVRLSVAELESLGTVFARAKDGSESELSLASVRPFLNQMLVRFAGVTDCDKAGELRGNVLLTDPARLPQPEDGSVYLFQLVGLRVVTTLGQALGRVRDVWSTGAAPVLVVRAGDDTDEPGRERLIPMSPDMLVGVDLEEGTIEVRLLPGMEDL